MESFKPDGGAVLKLYQFCSGNRLITHKRKAMDTDEIASGFMSLSQEEKKAKILTINNMIAKEMYTRYSTYVEIDKQMQEKYDMNYDQFRSSPRLEIDLDLGEYERASELWEMAREGINTLSGSLSKMMNKNSINN